MKYMKDSFLSLSPDEQENIETFEKLLQDSNKSLNIDYQQSSAKSPVYHKLSFKIPFVFVNYGNNDVTSWSMIRWLFNISRTWRHSWIYLNIKGTLSLSSNNGIRKQMRKHQCNYHKLIINIVYVIKLHVQNPYSCDNHLNDLSKKVGLASLRNTQDIVSLQMNSNQKFQIFLQKTILEQASISTNWRKLIDFLVHERSLLSNEF